MPTLSKKKAAKLGRSPPNSPETRRRKAENSRMRANLNAKTRKNALKAIATSSNRGKNLAKVAAERFAKVHEKEFDAVVKAAMNK